MADPAEAAGSDFGRGLLARLAQDGDGLLGWVVAVDDVDSVARRLGTTITTIRRAGLSARLTALAEAMREPFLPFFISRDPVSASASSVRVRAVPGEPAALVDLYEICSRARGLHTLP